MATALKTSSFKQGLRSSFSSGGVFSFSNLALDQQSEIPQAEQLDTLDNIITEIEETKKTELKDSEQNLENIAQAVPQVLNQVTTQLQPSAAAQISKKETLVSANLIPETAIDLGGGVQVVERERNPEIPPEVESFLQHASDHANQLPEEIVIADNQEISTTTHYPKNPVLILPISKEDEIIGKKKSPKFSIRWLVEWSYKIIKKFSGKVIYRMEEES